MSAPFVVACTHCESKLKLKDESFAGKKVRCPKCQQVFVAAAAGSRTGAAGKGQAAAKKRAKPKDEFDLSDISEDDYEPPPPAEGEEEQELEDLPASPLMQKKTAGKGGKKKKKRASSGPDFGRVALLGLLVLLGIGVVGGMGYGIYKIVSGLGGGPGRFAWLPDDAELVVELRPGELWRSPVLQPLTGGELGQRMRTDAQQNLGVELDQLERLVMGGSMTARSAVTVAYASAPLDQQKLVDLLSQGASTDHAGHALYPVANGVMFFPDPKTLVRGPETAIKAAIDRQGVCPVADKFASLPTGRHLALRTTKMENQTGQVPQVFSQLSAQTDKLRALSIGLDLTTDIALDLTCECLTAADAAALVAEMQRQRDEGLTQIQTQKAQLTPNPFIDVTKLQGLLTAVETALQSYQPAASGDTVTARLKVPGSVVKDGADMFAMLAPMLGGMGGGMAAPSGITPAPASPGEQP